LLLPIMTVNLRKKRGGKSYAIFNFFAWRLMGEKG